MSTWKCGTAVLALVLLAGFATEQVLAEPYLAVYKGMHCSGCHSHPAGGGKRNAYGNVFAQSEMPAARLGAGPVIGIDLSEEAVRVSRDNARRFGLALERGKRLAGRPAQRARERPRLCQPHPRR